MRDTELPIILRRVIYAGRQTVLIDDQHFNEDGITPMDMTGYTVAGDVRAAVDPTSTLLAAITFDNDLATGVIRAIITEADATAIEAGAVGGQAYFDVKVTDTLGNSENWYAGTLPVSKVVTP